MKRKGNLFSQIVSTENLRGAIHDACKGKSSYSNVQYIKEHLDEHVEKLRTMLMYDDYTVAQYRQKKIHEPKERLISILPLFPDRVIQHAIMRVVEPHWDSLMIKDSYSCRKGKGQHAGSITCMRYCTKYKYVLKCDISKFYPSLDHVTLKGIIRRKIKDYRLLNLIDKIIDSYGHGVGVPIGSYLSQWLGNLYMNELDMCLKHTHRRKAYIRYCDDFVIFSNEKADMRYMQCVVKAFCAKLHLRMSKCEYFPTAHGIDFLGYRHFPDGKILLRKRTAKRFRTQVNTLEVGLRKQRIPLVSARSKVASMHGWLKHANTHNFAKSLRLDALKEIIDEGISKASQH